MTLKNGMICTAISELMIYLCSSIAISKDWTTAGRTLLESVSLYLASTWYVMSFVTLVQVHPTDLCSPTSPNDQSQTGHTQKLNTRLSS
jgi:hypothetical protein